LIIVEIVPDPIWKEREQYWMSFYRALEAPLRNRATGGHGRTGIIETAEERMRKSLRQTGKSPTLKTRARMSAANTGKKLTNETRKKLSAALTGKTVSQKTRDKLSTALKGRSAPWVAETNHKKKGKPLSESHRAAISAAHTGVPHPISKSAREKTGAALRGRKRPADVVAKVANAHKGLKHTKESRKKMRLSHLGKKRSPESIAKQVATIRAKIAAKEQHPN
jgi:hypothetical protein